MRIARAVKVRKIKKVTKRNDQRADGLAGAVMQGIRLALFTKAAGWTLKDLARKLKVSYSTMKRYTKGTSPIQEDFIGKLAKISNLNPDWLKTGRFHMAEARIFARRPK